jgi:dienelactone hydrolase
METAKTPRRKVKTFSLRTRHLGVSAVGLILFLTTICFAEMRIAKGQLADPVASAYDPKQTHALYIPTTYTPEKKWPILFCYEARGRGRIPVELFREAAERLGWIIFSSNHSRSDDPNAPNLEVLNAMWNDSHKWFSIDERRVYATGFSGGARLAWGMGYVFPKSMAGVIGVGAGAHSEKPPTSDTPFVWYGIAGNKDFNYLELQKLDRQLGDLKIPHRVEFFKGVHEWPPADYCARSLEWMELQAMRLNRRAKDTSWIQQQFDKQLAEARKIEAANLFEAYQKYGHLQEDFQGLIDIGDVPKKVTELANAAPVKKALEERKKREEREQKFLDSFVQTLGAFRMNSEMPTFSRLRGDLKIAQLQKEAKEKGETEDGLVAQRLLETIFVQTAFYLPTYFQEQKDYERALLSLSIGTDIHSDVPWVWFNVATAQMQHGNKKKALESLKTAIDRGFKYRSWVDQEKSFDPIRNDPEFQQLLARIPAEKN